MSTLAAGTYQRPGDLASYVAVAAWSLAVVALTDLHHVYGAVIYDTPWRLHVLAVGIPIGAVIAAAMFVAHRRAGTTLGRTALWIGLVVIAAFPVLVIGIYEGGFNHVFKNVAYFGWGMDGLAAISTASDNPIVTAVIQVVLGEDAYAQMMAAGMLEPPGDVFFEATGILQLPVALVALWTAFRLWKAVR